jgi:hypothetical protein
MKIRLGYVSNSSSSSFVVSFDKIPETCEELRKIMFPDELQTIVEYYDNSCSVDEVVQQVFKDIKNQKLLSEDEIKEEISTGHFEGWPDYDSSDGPLHDFDEKFYKKFGNNTKWKDYPDWVERRSKILNMCYEAHNKEIEDAACKFYDNNEDKFKDKICFKFEYSDNEGFAVMEHAGIFDNLPHIQISHH